MLPEPGSQTLSSAAMSTAPAASQSLPRRALDAGLRRPAFSPDAASLLTGLLAGTRIGLPPRDDDELTQKLTYTRQPPVCWAHERSEFELSDDTVHTQWRAPHEEARATKVKGMGSGRLRMVSS